MKKPVVVITTTNTEKEALDIVNAILSKRLAACAQIFEIKSSYWWNGKIENSNEYRIEFKTLSKCVKKIFERIKSLHSYEVPEIVALPIIKAEKNYINWIIEETLK
jgi:periplasmic divalent cation tolerance protein